MIAADSIGSFKALKESAERGRAGLPGLSKPDEKVRQENIRLIPENDAGREISPKGFT